MNNLSRQNKQKKTQNIQTDEHEQDRGTHARCSPNKKIIKKSENLHQKLIT